MKQTYEELKMQYDEVGKELVVLYAKQSELQELMAEACPHKKLIKVHSDSDSVFYLGEEEEEEKHKCTDCYRYFKGQELKELLKKNAL